MSASEHPWTAEWARYCPRCGGRGFDSTDGRRHACATGCGFVYFHNLAAAVCAVLRRGRDIALIVRGKDPGRGLLDLPGGFVDPGEDLETAIRRETVEELGFDPGPPRYLFSIPNIYRYRGVNYHTLDAMFTFEVDAIPAVTPNSEVLALHWRDPREVAPGEVAFDSVREALHRLCVSAG